MCIRDSGSAGLRPCPGRTGSGHRPAYLADRRPCHRPCDHTVLRPRPGQPPRRAALPPEPAELSW
eukprot:13757526-Alexandrium_andersonii.AAC.1